MEVSEPVRFLTSRGDEIMAFLALGKEVGITVGKVVDGGVGG